MKRPYDLMSFLEQERRVDRLDSVKKEMADHNMDLEEKETAIDLTFEARFFASDEDCQARNSHLLTNVTLNVKGLLLGGGAALDRVRPVRVNAHPPGHVRPWS